MREEFRIRGAANDILTAAKLLKEMDDVEAFTARNLSNRGEFIEKSAKEFHNKRKQVIESLVSGLLNYLSPMLEEEKVAIARPPQLIMQDNFLRKLMESVPVKEEWTCSVSNCKKRSIIPYKPLSEDDKDEDIAFINAVETEIKNRLKKG